MILGPRRSIRSADPASQSGFRAWYRELYTASGGAVSQWTDKSGNGFHATQSTAARKPVVSATGGVANGREIYRFTRTADATTCSFMDLVAKSSLISASGFSIYFVVRGATNATVNYNSVYDCHNLLVDSSGGGFNGQFGVGTKFNTLGTSSFGVDWPAGGTFTQSTIASAATNVWKRLCVSYDGTRSYVRVAGGASVGDVRSNVGSLANILKVGGWNGGGGTSGVTGFFDGDLGEMIFYNQYHAVSVQDLIFGYQQTYFGI